MKIDVEFVRENLRNIEKVGADLLKQVSSEDFVGVAINWASLNIVEAVFVLTENGSYYQIIVDEVAPEARKFASVLEGMFAERGWEVGVITEW